MRHAPGLSAPLLLTVLRVHDEDLQRGLQVVEGGGVDSCGHADTHLAYPSGFAASLEPGDHDSVAAFEERDGDFRVVASVTDAVAAACDELRARANAFSDAHSIDELVDSLLYSPITDAMLGEGCGRHVVLDWAAQSVNVRPGEPDS